MVVKMRPNTQTTIVKMSTSKVSAVTRQCIGDQDDATEVDIELSFPQAEGLIEDKLIIETSSPQWTLHIPIVAYVTDGK